MLKGLLTKTGALSIAGLEGIVLPLASALVIAASQCLMRRSRARSGATSYDPRRLFECHASHDGGSHLAGAAD